MKRRLVKVFLAVLALFVLLNVVAYRHAYRMTHFVPAGTKTKSPEKLSVPAKMWTLLCGVEIPKPALGPVKAEFPQPARTVSFVTRDGVKLEAWDIPASGSEHGVAVMFHGYAVSRSALLGEARVLHELGWRTMLVDFRGSGGSDGLVTTLGWREAMDVTAATDWVRREWPSSRMILFGQSMGAVAVLRAIAMEGVKADGVILECPFDTLVHTVAHRYQAMGLPWFPFTQMLVFWGGVQHGFNGFAHNPAVYARTVSCRALVLDGVHDPWVMPDEVQRVAEAMRGPTVCHIFPGGGHSGYWWEVPEEYRKVAGEWIASIPTNQKTGNEK